MNSPETTKPCRYCGAQLPADAAYCPHCAKSQIDKTVRKPPRPWRKKALIAAACALIAAIAAAAVALWHRPVTLEGEGSVVYRDRDGEYTIMATFMSNDIIENKVPNPRWETSLAGDAESIMPALLGVVKGGEPLSVEVFDEKVADCTLEISEGDGAVEFGEPTYMPIFGPTVRASEIYYTGKSGTNTFLWTLHMKNGDTIRLSTTFAVTELVRRAYTQQDAPMSDMTELSALLTKIAQELDSDVIADVYLPAGEYEGDLVIASRAVNLYGCNNGSGRTVFHGTLDVRCDTPANVAITDIDFIGEGSGTGLCASASVDTLRCSFENWDVGALVQNEGMITVDLCTFRNNGVGLRYDTHSYHAFKDVFPECLVENNGIGVQFQALPGDMTMDFQATTFRGNGTDIDNPIGFPVNLENAIFE